MAGSGGRRCCPLRQPVVEAFSEPAAANVVTVSAQADVTGVNAALNR